jgi:phosphodiesterase/alkaline phosphatase D-like protein
MGSGASRQEGEAYHVTERVMEQIDDIAKLEGEELAAAVKSLKTNCIADIDKVTSDPPLVFCGPIVGKVDATSAIVMLELDEAAEVEIVATSADGHEVKHKRAFPAAAPRCFKLEGLKAGTSYTYTFNGLAPSQKKEIDALKCNITTTPDEVKEIKVLVQSCDRPDRLVPGDENPWSRLNNFCTEGKCDVLLHLGDQVYTKMGGFLERACLIMDLYDDPDTTEISKKKMINEAKEELRRSYRYVWSRPQTRACLSQSSHLMLWSDNDVANDFTEALKKGTEEQKYSDQFIMAAMGVYTEYQRQLWDPSCEGALPEDKSSLMEEWHFHTYGGMGIFMTDMRGNRITSGGVMKKGDIMSVKQKAALEEAFKTPGLSCMLVASEIPFVSESPAEVQAAAKFVKFLEGHWAYKEDECTWLYDLCFDWKAAAEGREVVLLGGDIHTGVMTDLKCNKTNSTIKSVTASPITNHVCGFYNKPTGKFNDRYDWEHKHFPDMRNFCKITAKFEDGKCDLDVAMELIPASKTGEQKFEATEGAIKKLLKKGDAATDEDAKALVEKLSKMYYPEGLPSKK